jgi:hypothetical protein
LRDDEAVLLPLVEKVQVLNDRKLFNGQRYTKRIRTMPIAFNVPCTFAVGHFKISHVVKFELEVVVANEVI